MSSQNTFARDTIESIATEIAREIKAKENYRSSEYVAVIYRTNEGDIKKSDLFTENSYRKAPLGAAIQESTTAKEVLAVIHNHPLKLGSIAFRVDCPLCEAVALGRLCGWNNSSHTHWV